MITRKKSSLLAGCTLFTLGLAISTGTNAAGFFIQEQSVSGLGMAFSGSSTNIEDPSTIFFNPAGMTKLSGTQAQAGAHLLILSADLTDTGTTNLVGGTGNDGGNPYDPTLVPNMYLSHEISNDLWAGIGVSAPFGLGHEYDSNWFGRYDSIKTELKIIDIQPTLAYKLSDEISIGVGLNIEHSEAELVNAVFLGAGNVGTGTLEGDDWGFGYTVGLQLTPTEGTTIGLNYRSTVHHKLDGAVVIEGTGTAGDGSTDAYAKLATPDVATFGVSHDLGDQWTVMGQATWFGWNNFQDITSVNKATGAQISQVLQNYQTTWAFALGAEYEHSNEWTFRGGMQLDETPTTDLYRTTRTPDGDRTWFSLGATYNVSEKIALDLAATYIDVAEEKITLQRNGAVSNISGTSEGQVGILALGATYKF